MVGGTASRWRRYGHDRLYLNDARGAGIGYLDLRTGMLQDMPPGRADEARTLAAQWLTDHPELIPPEPDGQPAAARHDATDTAAAPADPALSDGIEMHSSPATSSRSPTRKPPAIRRHAPDSRDEATDWIPHPRPVTPASLQRPPKLSGAAHQNDPGAAEPGHDQSPEIAINWHDLAANRPGQAVAEQAATARAQRPVSSRIEPLFGIHSQAQAWRKGAAGERATAAALRRLTRPWWGRLWRRAPQWRVLHSIPIGERGSDIDHVLIGPAGVFTINSKWHKGAAVWVGEHGMTVNRHAVPYIPKARTEAARAQDRINTHLDGAGVLVVPIVAVVGARLTGRNYTLDHVLVTDVADLARTLRRMPRMLDEHQVAAAYDIARRSTTWQ